VQLYYNINIIYRNLEQEQQQNLLHQETSLSIFRHDAALLASSVHRSSLMVKPTWLSFNCVFLIQLARSVEAFLSLGICKGGCVCVGGGGITLSTSWQPVCVPIPFCSEATLSSTQAAITMVIA